MKARIDSRQLPSLLLVPGALLLPLAALAGCGGEEAATKIVYGDVTCDGEAVELGYVRFVPIEGTEGPPSMQPIAGGKYRIEARGGVPLGKHRIEVEAHRKTGKQVERFNGFERAMVDEKVAIGAIEYEGEQSPLVEQITADSEAQINLEIPAGKPRPVR